MKLLTRNLQYVGRRITPTHYKIFLIAIITIEWLGDYERKMNKNKKLCVQPQVTDKGANER